ncbi:hypothetical protein QE397_001417 [Rhodococcus sp. SORGH_AS 301]|nr:hypothetical protein [Rhodococcus sp. SORGH_AS_0301]
MQCEDGGVSSSQQSEPPVTVSHTESPTSDASPAAPTVFRIPALALSGVALFLFGVTFPVVGAPELFGWMLALPVLLGYWIIRVRTTVTPERFVSRRAFRSTTVPWSSVTGLLFPKLGWGKATLEDGSTVRMPGVTVDKLPLLSAASGGAVPDPSPVEEPAQDEPVEAESAVEQDEAEPRA